MADQADTGRRRGILTIDGWSGRLAQPVEVVGETPTQYRISSTRVTRLGGRHRWLHPGQVALVPKHAVTVVTPEGN